MGDVTICFTYFRSLTLQHLAAALYSVKRQDLRRVQEIIIVDNNTEDDKSDVANVVDAAELPVPSVRLLCCKHGDPTRTHAWSANKAVGEAKTHWVLFTRADYLLDFNALSTLLEAAESTNRVFATGRVYHLHEPLAECEARPWRTAGTQALMALQGISENYMEIDSGVWLIAKAAFEAVDGLDERLTAWGHAQTLFQYRLHQVGVETALVPQVLFYHPLHGAPRDIELAHSQLAGIGENIRDLWARYRGGSPY